QSRTHGQGVLTISYNVPSIRIQPPGEAMDIQVVTGDITQQATAAVVVNLFDGVTVPGGATGAVDRALGGAVSKVIADGEIKGSAGQMCLIHTLGRIPPERVLVAGLGKSGGFGIDGVRAVTAESARYVRGKGVKRFATIAHGAGIGRLDARSVGQAMGEGLVMGLYRFDKYRAKKEDASEIEEVLIVESDAAKAKELAAGVEEGRALAEAVNLARDMVNEPANYMTPTRMAEVALDVAHAGGLGIEVFDRSRMREMGMGALLGVAQGSNEPPKLIVLRYDGDPADKDNNLGLLGKGITFDSGGISLKPAEKMGEMKGDMAGGAAVIAAMKAIAHFKPKINVVGIVAATENMPGGRAQRPGDIVKAMNGKTIEIDNTDAEGRLVLADAASYASSIGIKRIVDAATLTGAMVVALGNHYTGAFGNDQKLVDAVIAAGKQGGERIWQMPIADDYKKQYESDVADMKNIGGRAGGSITGAMIIGEFVGDAAWVHLDIAGTSTTEKNGGWNTKGATGTPARTFVHLAQALARG
ncbi:MAG: leucyl aminopeptidase, partial [SAR202 cluster bacterium]|nr:leucyl aminopeptidase [SAR202 cluster bacterium]